MGTTGTVRLALGTACALGLARFSFGLLVPAMRTELHWTLAQAGAMTTANALGYLVGAVATAPLARRFGTTATFRAGMVVTALALAANAASPLFPVLLTMRTIAGFSGALVFISGSVIAARRATSAGSATPLTVYFAGGGVGIMIAAALVPPLVDAHAAAWPLAWAAMAALAVLAAVASWGAAHTDDVPAGSTGGRAQLRPLWTVAVAYFFFAVGYLSYITFLSAYLAGQQASTGRVVLTWTALGLATVVAPAVVSRPIATWPGGRALATLLAGMAVAAGLALASPALIAVSAVVYGLTLMNIPAAVTARVRAYATPADLSPSVAQFTVLFAVGQTVGPWLAGWVADHTTVGATLTWTAVLCAIGVGFALLPTRAHART